MSKTKGDAPAFPKPLDPYPNMQMRGDGGNPGMDLRTYIATQVLAGLGDWTPNQDDGSPPDWTSMAALRKRRAEWAVAQADALIAALNAEPGHDR